VSFDASSIWGGAGGINIYILLLQQVTCARDEKIIPNIPFNQLSTLSMMKKIVSWIGLTRLRDMVAGVLWYLLQILVMFLLCGYI
jgi:hypothetical protein